MTLAMPSFEQIFNGSYLDSPLEVEHACQIWNSLP